LLPCLHHSVARDKEVTVAIELAVAVVFVMVLLFASIKIVPEYQRLVVLRLGKVLA